MDTVLDFRIKHAEFQGHNYFFSWEYDLTKDLKVDWITGRNICRRHCMDLVSIETREENEFVKSRMINGLIRFFWTSGRKCNFAGCDREDLQPSIVNGESRNLNNTKAFQGNSVMSNP